MSSTFNILYLLMPTRFLDVGRLSPETLVTYFDYLLYYSKRWSPTLIH